MEQGYQLAVYDRAPPAHRMELVPWWNEAKSVLNKDPFLTDVVARYPDEGLAIQNEPFVTLARAIVGQQISVTAADTVWKRLEAMCEGNVTVSRIVELSPDILRSAGCSFRKGEYLIHVAERIDEFLEEGVDEEGGECECEEGLLRHGERKPGPPGLRFSLPLVASTVSRMISASSRLEFCLQSKWFSTSILAPCEVFETCR